MALVDVNLLRAYVFRAGFSNLEQLAEAMGVKVTLLYSKTSGRRRFSVEEIAALQKILHISDTDVVRIFIQPKVQPEPETIE